MTRPARARIDRSALRHNYALARQMHGGRALAVIKANAYGHGAVPCAHALQDLVDGFAVAFVGEAMALREAGITAPILVLEGAFDTDDWLQAAERRLWMVVHQSRQLEQLSQLPPHCRYEKLWLKIDSGMHRAGFAPEDVAPAWAQLHALQRTDEVVLMTHFARADEPTEPMTPAQLATFQACTQGLTASISVSNSAGVLAWPDARADWARPGIMLYGSNPLGLQDRTPLKPVMTLQSEVFAERWIAPGETVGYGGRFVAPRRTRVGLVAMGYADGYPRTLGDGTPVAVDGHVSQLIGRVSMDMLTIDLTDHPQAGPGSTVELWGSQISVDMIAQRASTIAYELLCNTKRVSFEYL